MLGVVRRGVAVRAHVIGPQRVDGDEQDVGLGAARPRGQRRQRGASPALAAGGPTPDPPPVDGKARSATDASAVRS